MRKSMAKSRKKNKKLGKGGRIALVLCAAAMIALGAYLGYAALNANIVRVRRAEVALPDLPAAFEGTTILYASDVDLCGLNTAKKCGALFAQLQSLSPDLLILGGDYTSASLLEILNSPEGNPKNMERQLRERSDFFHFISDFRAPLGKYAIASPDDPEPQALAKCLLECNVHPLFNERTAIESGGETLWLAGICKTAAGLNSAGQTFSRDDCAVVAAYSPEVLPVLLTSEAKDGGQWADLVLCGHTHGGQIRLFGRSVLQLSRAERQYLSGWTVESGLPILTTEGVGCEGANLRIGTAPEVWMITLRRS